MINFLKWVYKFYDFVTHLDTKLEVLHGSFGSFTLVILFIIVFCESGIIFFPFLPGSSLLFAAGAFAAKGFGNIYWEILVLAFAGIFGAQINYHLGKFVGPYIYKSPWSYFIRNKKRYLELTQNYFGTYGNKTVLYSSFLPIFRTFSPFLAGVGRMSYKDFSYYNAIGTVAWVTFFSFFGYFLGSIPGIKNHFLLVLIGIVFITTLPVGIHYVKRLATRN